MYDITIKKGAFMKKLSFWGLFAIVLCLFSPQASADRYYRHPYHHRHQHHHTCRHFHGGYIYCNLCHLYHRETHHHFRHGPYEPVAIGQERVIESEQVIGTREVVE